MANPETEIRWGGGRWKRSMRRSTRQWLEPAIDLTEEMLTELGVSYEEPKHVTVWTVGNAWDLEHGASDGVDEIELYLSHRDIKNNKLRRHFVHLALTSFHEFVHCIRYEHVTQDNLMERVVSEGLASYGESLFAGYLLNEVEGERYAPEFSCKIAPHVERVLLDHLLQDAAEEELLQTIDPEQAAQRIDDIYGAWFDGQNPHTLGAGAGLGLLAVGRLADLGCEFRELITLPTHDIISLPSMFEA